MAPHVLPYGLSDPDCQIELSPAMNRNHDSFCRFTVLGGPCGHSPYSLGPGPRPYTTHPGNCLQQPELTSGASANAMSCSVPTLFRLMILGYFGLVFNHVLKEEARGLNFILEVRECFLSSSMA